MHRSLTPKGEATRARIIEGAAQVLRESSSVAAATLDDIRQQTGTSKSQLFHYFPEGKDQLLLAVAQYEADRVLDDQQPYLSHLTSWDAWYRWRDVVVERYRSQGSTCPLSALSLQLGRTTPGARAIVMELLNRWQAELAAGIRAMRDGGHLPASYDVDEAAAALLAGVQGGVSIMMSTGRSTHLEAAIDVGIRHLRMSGQELALP